MTRKYSMHHGILDSSSYMSESTYTIVRHGELECNKELSSNR